MAEAQRGFTLVEIMVALAVFSLAAMALIRLEGATIRAAATVDATLTARMVANNVAVEALTDARAPVVGRVAGSEINGGRRWRWQREVTPTGAAGIVRIDVAVADDRGTVLGRTVAVRRGGVGE